MSQAESQENTSAFVRKWWPLLAVLIGFLPLMYWHVAGLLQRPHYQFLILLPVMLWILHSAADQEKVASVSRAEILSGMALLVIAIVGLSYATMVWSPWIAAIAFLVALFSAFLLTQGWAGIFNWFPTWVFLWILVPLPFGLDEDLIVYLRGITTRLSSSVLDQLGTLHNSYANVIELPGKPLFIADACSGIHSLYVLMAAALFLAMWQRRGVIHTASLLTSTFALVLIENVTRIVMVAILWNRGYDFSIGLKHELLGIGLFCLSLVFVVSIDQLLLFLLPTRIPSLVKWIYQRLSGQVPDRKPKFRAAPQSIDRKLVFGLAAVLPVVGVSQLFLMPAAPPNPVVALYDDFELPELGRKAMPESIGVFQLEDYFTVERVPGDPLGQASQQWQYSDGRTSALISIDYPYSGLHDLCECYSAIGWSIPSRRIDSAEEQGGLEHVDGPVAVAHLKRDLYGNALLLFNLVDTQGETDVVIKDIARGDTGDRAARRFDSFSGKPENESQMFPPYIQFQLFARTTQVPNEEHEKQLTAFFLEARNILRQAISRKEAQ